MILRIVIITECLSNKSTNTYTAWMANIKWLPQRPDSAIASRVEEIVHFTIGTDAEGEVVLVVDEADVIKVPQTRLVPSPAVWDTLGEPIRVDGGLVEALLAFGLRAKATR